MSIRRIAQALSLAGLLLAATAPAEAKTKVVIGEQNWTGAVAIQHVLKVIMEKYLEGEVSSIAAAEPILWEAMDRGDGTADILPDAWTDHLPEQMNKFVVPGSKESILLNAQPYLGVEGIYIPGFVQDKYNIRKVTDLANPEMAKIFDTDGDGKGDWWAGAVGWEATNHSLVRAKSYGFEPYFMANTVETPIFLSQLDAAMTKQQPILFYYWEPEWIHAVFDLRKLEEPKFDGYTTDDYKGTPRFKADGCYTFYQPGVAPDWLEKSKILCDQPPTSVYIAYSKALAARAPAIGKFLSQVVLTGDMVNEWILAIDREKKKPEEVAAAWVDGNLSLVEGTWLKDVPRAN